MRRKKQILKLRNIHAIHMLSEAIGEQMMYAGYALSFFIQIDYVVFCPSLRIFKSEFLIQALMSLQIVDNNVIFI